MAQLTLASRNKKKFRTPDELSVGENVHIRMICETYNVCKHMDYLPIVLKNKNDQKNESSLFDDIWVSDLSQSTNYGRNVSDVYNIVREDNKNLASYVKLTNKHNNNNSWEYWIIDEEEVFSSEETFIKNYGKITSTVFCERKTFLFTETDKHYKITTYQTRKMRLCGYKYFKTTKIIASYILNKNTGDVYFRVAKFNNRVWSTKLVKNSMIDLIERFGNNILIPTNICHHKTFLEETPDLIPLVNNDKTSQIILTNQHIAKICFILNVNVLDFFPTQKPYDAITKDRYSARASDLLSMVIVKWFLKNKKIKHPDNPFLLLKSCYPKIKQLRKNNMNLAHAVLDLLGMKTKVTNKILNRKPEFSCFNLAIWYHLFGHNYFSQINVDVIFYKETFYRIVDVFEQLNIQIHGHKDLTDKRNWKIIGNILSDREKLQFLRILQSIDSKTDICGVIQLGDILEHISIKNQLLAFNCVLKVKAKTYEEFVAEHDSWSKILNKYQKDKQKNYVYMDSFLSVVEESIVVTQIFGGDVVYYPIILKNSYEYNSESEIQKHCVRGYIENHNSIIISIRENSPFSVERITCEYRYNSNDKKFMQIQKRGKCNSPVDEKYVEVLDELETRMNSFAKKHSYENPKIELTYNKVSGITNNSAVDVEFEPVEMPF